MSAHSTATQRPVTETIPAHLRSFIAPQGASDYTPLDHAAWRYILRVSKAFFAKTAHPKYLAGLDETGISTERIPLIEEMDQKLRRFGWRAVPVSGFIPPAAFMEFQSLGILPIAREMRTLEHLAYTPAPDIVHEAAGHAPILADPEYAAYLRAYGEVARKAIFSDRDQRVYEAVRALSDTKEDPAATPAQIADCQRELDAAVQAVTEESEAALLARMNWWTVEYGLVGPLDSPKIYGAGLLSSIGESYHCLSPAVRKIPFDVRCIETSYDITRPQPQLFVAENFDALTRALEDFARTMAFRIGGKAALDRGIGARALVTVELDSGAQASGILERCDVDAQGRPAFLKFRGASQLARAGRQLDGQGPRQHAEGFSSPIGRLRGKSASTSSLTRADLEAMGFRGDERGRLEWESGIMLEGVLTGEIRHDGRAMVLSFRDAWVRRGDQVLFQPDWGVYDLICGESVTSVFGGAADRGAYLAETGGLIASNHRPKSNLTAENRELNELAGRIRKLRESKPAATGPALEAAIQPILEALDARYPDDWLSRLELVELLRARGLKSSIENAALKALERISASAPQKREMIERGLALL